MVKPLQRYAKVGLLLALFVGLIGAQGDGGCRQMAMENWEDLQAQLDSHQEQLDSQQDQICDLYKVSDLPFPPECITIPPCPPTDPDCDPPPGPGPGPV